VYYYRGAAYYEKEDYDKAIPDYTVTIRSEPDYAAAYYNRGPAYADKKDIDKALADIPRPSGLTPTMSGGLSPW
jgi:tetratricopeptide (TPR) repeat protein